MIAPGTCAGFSVAPSGQERRILGKSEECMSRRVLVVVALFLAMSSALVGTWRARRRADLTGGFSNERRTAWIISPAAQLVAAR
jgi:hypothetical protein